MTAATAAATASAAARDAAIRRRNGAWVASLAARHPPRNTQPAHPRRFFFRPRRYFTMRKIFLCRKKSCCVAQHAALQDGKKHFLSRNKHDKQLIYNDKKFPLFLNEPLFRNLRFA
ncbi:hypothetical protein [Burkholderia ubonensis]|uniref:hypothetical protein n=1 Tax=Burkholderia ubonensis TaxID=101571 RepID=UPI0012F7263E|nr:hypothetical protein [Burkholderia ubonensis]